MAELLKEKFHVEFLPEAVEFIEDLDEKAKEKVLYNIRKTQFVIDSDLFKKLTPDIWEFRTLFGKFYYRILAFWDRTDAKSVLVLATHGFVKKSSKTPDRELERAAQIRNLYFDQKQ